MTANLLVFVVFDNPDQGQAERIASGRYYFDRRQIIGRIGSVEAGQTTKLERCLAARLAQAERENERLREYVYAHTLIEKGVGDFDLHAETVERFRLAQDACADVVRAALAAPNPDAADSGEAG